MRTKNYILLLATAAVVFFSSCNNKVQTPGRPLATSSGSSLQDTVLPKLLVKLVHTSSANFLAYYWTNSLVVDTTQNPPQLTLMAQSAKYDATNDSYVLHNGSTTSQVSSALTVATDTVIANYAGPFDPTIGRFYTLKGYLHYTSKYIADTCICPIASIVYYNQNGTGAAVSIGFVMQQDLHSPAPPSLH